MLSRIQSHFITKNNQGKCIKTMKIKENFVFERIMDENIIIPIGKEADQVHGIIRLNDSGAFLWDCLSNGKETNSQLEQALIDKYKIDPSVAREDVLFFINNLKSIGCLEF